MNVERFSLAMRSVTSLALARRPPWIVVVGDEAGNVLFFRIETERPPRGRG